MICFACGSAKKQRWRGEADWLGFRVRRCAKCLAIVSKVHHLFLQFWNPEESQ